MMLDRIVPQVSQDVKDVLDRINAVGERNRKEYEALARMTGMSIAEVEADLTAPDPGLEEECSLEWCHEPVFRDGDLCLDHLIAEEELARDDRDAALDGGWWGDPAGEVLA